jgi:hypothetical protein
MKYFILLALFVGMWTANGLANNLNPVDLSVYHWKNRLLFLFASSEKDPSYLALREEIARQGKEIRDRDLLIFYVFEKGQSRLDTQPLTPGQVRSVKKQITLTPGPFWIILIGKDGGEKIREDRFVGLEEIFKVIDAMPMRRQEMRKN